MTSNLSSPTVQSVCVCVCVCVCVRVHVCGCVPARSPSLLSNLITARATSKTEDSRGSSDRPCTHAVHVRAPHHWRLCLFVTAPTRAPHRHLFMAALRSRCGHYVIALWFLLYGPLWNRADHDIFMLLLWPPYEIEGPLYFCPVVTIFLSFFLA